MTTKSKKQQQQRLDWSLAPRGAVSATLQAGLGLEAVAALGHVAHLSPAFGLGGAVVGALGTVMVASQHNASPTSIMYRLGCWTGAGGWLTWAWMNTGPWTMQSISTMTASLAVGAIAAGVCAPLGRYIRTAGANPGTRVVLRSGGALGAEWEGRLVRVARVKGLVTDVRHWANRAGYDVHVDLPPGGTTIKNLEAQCEGLAADARLPFGCGVRVLPGRNRGEVVLAVSAVNRLGEEVFFPDDYSPRSVLAESVFGEHSNSDPAGAELRQESMLVAGKRGSGKTTLLQDITLALLRCTDHLVWHLDLNGGGITQPWIDVWLDGLVERPPIDWPASGLVEAKLALRAGIAIAMHRKSSYRKLKREQDTTLLPVSPQLPQITLIVDEGAEAVKDRELSGLIGQLQNIGRDSAVNVVLSALRPTGDLVPVNMRKQAGVRVQMWGPDEDELAHMFGWKRGISMQDLAGVGTGFLSTGGSPRPFRAYNLRPSQIEAAALALARFRPDLDQASAEAAGPAYAGRLQRIREAFADGSVMSGDQEYQTAPPVVPTQADGRPRLTVMTGGGASTWADPRDLARPTARRRATGSASTWPDPPRRAHAVQVADGPAVPLPPAHTFHPQLGGTTTTRQPVPEILLRALAVFDELADHRVHSEVLADRLGMTTAELAAALRPLGVTSIDKFSRGGQNRRGYERPALQAAVDRIALTA